MNCITLLLSKFSIFAIAAFLLFPASSVYGHGFGIDTIRSVDVQGKKISISVELPTYFEQTNQKQITITATKDDTKENANNVTFLIGLFHDNKMIFKNYFFAANGILPIKIDSTQKDDDVVIHGEQDSLLGAWHGTESNPIKISGPILNSGGLYHFEIEVRTIDDPTNIVENSGVYNADVTIVDTTPFIQEDAEHKVVKFQIKSYFDKISNFRYDPNTKQVIFEMPFDWSEKQMSHIPVVHEEVHIPKNFTEFLSPSYTGKVNGITLFKASVTIDDYTEDDQRIVHFVLLQDHLRFIKNQIQKSGEPLPDKIIFTLSKGENIEFPLTAFTRSEDFQVNLSWDPLQIEPGKNTNFIFTIRDGKTAEPLRNSDYTFVIIQNGNEIYRTTGTAQVGGGFEQYKFAEDQNGATIIKFENIRNTGQETEFGIVVAPEFGTITIMILLSTLLVVVLASRNSLTQNLIHH
jgi:predicted secreted protein with PEFG-CTERM motif